MAILAVFQLAAEAPLGVIFVAGSEAFWIVTSANHRNFSSSDKRRIPESDIFSLPSSFVRPKPNPLRFASPCKHRQSTTETLMVSMCAKNSSANANRTKERKAGVVVAFGKSPASDAVSIIARLDGFA